MEHILREGTIKLINPIQANGITKKVYLLTHNRKKFVLRKCSHVEIADKYEEIYHRFEKFGFFPNLLWRDETQLIFEYIPGRDCKESDASQVAEDIGEIAGAVNSSNIPVEQYDFDVKFFKTLNFIEKGNILDTVKTKEIRSKYYNLRSKVNPRRSMDAKDIHSGNFRLYRGKVYFVDIDAIRPALKGIGIVKAIFNWFITSRQRELFFKGYNKFSDSSFFTADYRDFIFLYFIIRYIYKRYKENQYQLVTQYLKKLDKFFSGDKL